MRKSVHYGLSYGDRGGASHAIGWLNDNWRWLTFLAWIAIAAYFLTIRQANIYWFVLGDTDDNMRYLQVRDWIEGQGWFDLRQYRMDPPEGANMHWSRIVDLPIAGLMLLFRLFMDTGQADRWACAVAPLLPLLLLMWALALITIRLCREGSAAWVIAIFLPLAAPSGISMFMPMRIDHHGWQLALTVTMLAGIIDRKWLRGGIVAGVASALSVAIGMEMIVYLAGAGGLIALRWVFKEGATRRMLPYALALGSGTGVLYALFANYDNRAPMCDAISPIWVGTLGLAAGGMVLLAVMPLKGWRQRLPAGLIVGAIIGAFAYGSWPQCFNSAYQISPELDRLWLANIREAKSVLVQPLWRAIPMLALPVAGTLAAVAACFTVQRDTERLWAWATVALMTVFAMALTFWQIRSAPAAQLLAIPAVAWAAYGTLTLIAAGSAGERLGGVLIALVVAVMIWANDLSPYVRTWLTPSNDTAQTNPDAAKKRAAWLARIKQANARCRTLPALAPLNQLPAATIFTLVDMGPRLIAMTHHSAIAGPYHRNGTAILDVHHGFDGPAVNFRAIARRHGASYLLFCPNFPEGTIYQVRSPKGFYAQLSHGHVPGWLHPVPINSASKLPYILYRIDYAD